jgi:hypothetical protein
VIVDGARDGLDRLGGLRTVPTVEIDEEFAARRDGAEESEAEQILDGVRPTKRLRDLLVGRAESVRGGPVSVHAHRLDRRPTESGHHQVLRFLRDVGEGDRPNVLEIAVGWVGGLRTSTIDPSRRPTSLMSAWTSSRRNASVTPASEFVHQDPV